MTSTTKYVLYFTAKDGKSYKTITCKAQGRNELGSMTYELPNEAFKRFINDPELKPENYVYQQIQKRN